MEEATGKVEGWNTGGVQVRDGTHGTVSLASENIITGVRRGLGGIVIDDCYLIVRRLAPTRQLLPIHGTQED
jgi:hypothetical protein